MISEQCKGVQCVDLGESFQTHIFLLNFASVQPRTSRLKFARSSGAERVRAQARLVTCAASLRASVGKHLGKRIGGDELESDGSEKKHSNVV